MDRNNAQVTFPKATGFGQIMDQAIADYPDEEAMVCGKWRITYGEFGKLVNKTANMLRANGVTKGSTVAVVSRNSIEFMIADMAILKLGAISVKFSWRLSPKEMKYLFELNNVKWTFYRPETEEWAKEMYEYFEGRIQCFDLRVNGEESPIYAMTQEYSDEAVEVEVSGDDPAFHMHTSGTTGVPKCVVYTHGSILRELESTLMSFHYVPGQVYQFVSQMFHSAGMGAYMVLSTGGKLIILTLAVLFDISYALLGFFLGHGDVNNKIAGARLLIVQAHVLYNGNIGGTVCALNKACAGCLDEHEVASRVYHADMVHVHFRSGESELDMTKLRNLGGYSRDVDVFDLALGNAVFYAFEKFLVEISHLFCSFLYR